MAEDDDDLKGLRDLRQTLDGAAQLLSVFVGAAAGGAVAEPMLIGSAESTIADLGAWRAVLDAATGNGGPPGAPTH